MALENLTLQAQYVSWVIIDQRPLSEINMFEYLKV